MRDRIQDRPTALRLGARLSVAAFALALPLAGLAQEGTVQVSSQEGLYGALSQATGGETILLEPGLYGEIRLDRKSGFDVTFPAMVTIASADPADPAILTGFDVDGAANVTVEGVTFDYVFSEGDAIHREPFQVENCRNVAIRNSTFDGDLARGVSPEEDGYGWSRGLAVDACEGVTVEGNLFHDFHRGLVLANSSDVVVRGNRMHSLRSDGMNFSALRNALIEGNHLHDFRRARGTGDHPDMIQFSAANTERPSTNITIRANLLNSGMGDLTQSIFMRNEIVDRGRAGPEMFYRDLVIEENVIINGHVHGITVGEARGLRVRHNTLIRNQHAVAGLDREDRVTIPQLNVAEESVDVVIEANVFGRSPEGQPGWVVQGNLEVQDITRMRPNYYRDVFRDALAGDPRRLESFTYLPGSPAAAPGGPGAALLRP